jgi:peptide/nickel transport system permease protein
VLRFLGRRLIQAVVLLIGVSLLTFALAALAPGSFFDDLRLDPRVTPETVDALRERYGLDRPLAVRYGLWLRSAGRGDLGFSIAYHSDVLPLLSPRIANTLILTLTASVAAWAFALPAGIWAAAYRGTRAERMCSGAAAALVGVPDILIALLALLFASRTGLFPIGGMRSVRDEAAGPWTDLAWHLALPVATLVCVIAPPIFRHVRAAVIESDQATRVMAARALGVPRSRVLLRHALKLSANPLVTLAGLSVASLISASLLIEVVMAWPGLGPLMLEAVLARDVHLVAGTTTIAAALLISANLLSDVALYGVDPRIRAR